MFETFCVEASSSSCGSVTVKASFSQLLLLLSIRGHERVLCVWVAENPVVPSCEDMLPYIPILIHHLWNVRKCVVSRGLERQEGIIWFIYCFSNVHTCEVGEGCHPPWTFVWMCVFVGGGSGGNRWEAPSARAHAPLGLLKEPPIQSLWLLEQIPAQLQLLTVKEDWRSAAVTRYSKRTSQNGRGGMWSCHWGWGFVPGGRLWKEAGRCHRLSVPEFLNMSDLLSDTGTFKFQLPGSGRPAGVWQSVLSFFVFSFYPSMWPTVVLFLSLALPLAAKATRLAVAGQTEPSQVFQRGLVPFNQLLRRESCQHGI